MPEHASNLNAISDNVVSVVTLKEEGGLGMFEEKGAVTCAVRMMKPVGMFV